MTDSQQEIYNSRNKTIYSKNKLNTLQIYTCDYQKLRRRARKKLSDSINRRPPAFAGLYPSHGGGARDYIIMSGYPVTGCSVCLRKRVRDKKKNTNV